MCSRGVRGVVQSRVWFLKHPGNCACLVLGPRIVHWEKPLCRQRINKVYLVYFQCALVPQSVG